MGRIASEIRRLRTLQGMSAQVLADRINELGHTMSRSTLADIENGRRRYITVTELIVLARALNAAPVTLLIPGPYNDETGEVLPGVFGSQFEVSEWFCGSGDSNAPAFSDDDLAHDNNCRPLRRARLLKDLKSQRYNLERNIEAALRIEDNSRVDLYTSLLFDLNRRITEAEANAG